MYKSSAGFEFDYLNYMHYWRCKIMRFCAPCFCYIFAKAVKQLVMQLQVVVKASGLGNWRHYSKFPFYAFCDFFFFHSFFLGPILIKLRLGSTTIPKRNQRCWVFRKVIVKINHYVIALLLGSSKCNRQLPIFLYYKLYTWKSQ